MAAVITGTDSNGPLVVIPSGTHRRGVFATSTLTFPASFTVSSFGTLDSPVLFLGLY